MPKYKFEALNADGLRVTGVQVAGTAGLVNAALAKRNLRPVHVAEKKGVMQFEITRRKVPRKELMHFSRQLGAFLKAGISVLEALEVFRAEVTNKLFKKALTEMIEAIEAGETFADAAAVHPEAFPQFYIGILRSAEVTGSLSEVLGELAEYIERDLEARRRVSSALVYPAMVMFMAIGTVVILTVFVMPRFQKFFATFNAKLPLATRLLLGVSKFASQDWYFIAGPLVALFVIFAVSQRTGRGRALRDRAILRLPVVGNLVRFTIVERFCRGLSSMVIAGVPLPDALDVIANGMSNVVYRKGVLAARDSMLEGRGLAEPLAASNLFPSAARQMFKVGEETGTLGEQMLSSAVYFDRELEYKMKQFTAMFEPAVIMFIGLVVGFVAIALVSAMYGIYNQVKV
jgi:type IV pilus assembly protein PilC